MALSVDLAESGYVPGPALCQGMRIADRKRLSHESQGDIHSGHRNKMSFIRSMDKAPVAFPPPKAAENPFKVPKEFFKAVLGPNMLFSCCHFPEDVNSLEKAEEAMLKMICKRANIKDGQRILDLGCGWGGLSLWMAQEYPNADIIAVTSSCHQKEHLFAKIKLLGITNLHPVTVDMNNFAPRGLFDRIVSIELFGHLRNWRIMMYRISQWLEQEGRFFLQTFTHRYFAYAFDGPGPKDWMARYFFPNSFMPSDDLPLYFQDYIAVEDHWRISGAHYQKTAQAWLSNMRASKGEVMGIMENVYGKDRGKVWYQRWKNYFLASAALWGYAGGKEWMTSQYLMKKR